MNKFKFFSLIAAAACATLSGMAWAADFTDPDKIFRFKGDVLVGTGGTTNPVHGNLTVNGRSSAADPVLKIRNEVLNRNLMTIDRDGLATIGEGNRPTSDQTSLLHVKGALAVWPNAAQTWTNSRASATFAKGPDNYVLMVVPGQTTAGLALRYDAPQQDENQRNKMIVGVQKGAIEFKTGVTYNGSWEFSGNLRMKIDSAGRILGGEGLTATPGVASTSQVVLGKYNDTRTDDDDGVDHTKGVFVVGAGSNANTRQNAIRVLDNGTVLVRTSGDISPGEFTHGPTP